jgi:large subunit ribosomal protein L1
MKRGKQYLEKAKTIQAEMLYSPGEAIQMVKESSYTKFDETVELHFALGIDPRHADQQLRGTLVLPNGSGKTVCVVVIAKGEKAAEAKAAGADFVGEDDLVEKISKGWFDFDLVIATPDLMAKVGKLGRLLGAKGLMPNPKTGTVTMDVAKAVGEFKAGKMEYRNDKHSNLHLRVGKVSFTEQALRENYNLIYDTVVKVKPSKSKGVYLKSVTMCTSMGPAVSIEPMKTRWKDEV